MQADVQPVVATSAARGHRLGGQLVDPCVTFARHVYLSRGFRLVCADTHRTYGTDLIGQIYELEFQ